jgi:hypothetical protein
MESYNPEIYRFEKIKDKKKTRILNNPGLSNMKIQIIPY